MAVKEGTDLSFGQPFRSRVESFADAAGGGIDGSGVAEEAGAGRGRVPHRARGGGVDVRGVEEEAGAGLAIVPHGQGGVEMRGIDEGAAIEGGVDGAEAENL